MWLLRAVIIFRKAAESRRDHHNILWGLKNLCDSAMRHKGFCTSYVALGTPPLLNSSRPGPMPNLSLKLTVSFDSDSKVQSIWFPSSKCLRSRLTKLKKDSAHHMWNWKHHPYSTHLGPMSNLSLKLTHLTQILAKVESILFPSTNVCIAFWWK